VLGIAEDSRAKAVAAPGAALSDGEVGRRRQIVASLVSPLPTFDIMQVEDPQQAGHGFVLIAVPRSPSVQHAVLVNDGLRFPKRNGTITRYLSEPEAAAAYRDRFAGMRSRFDDLARHERDLVAAGGNATVRATVWPVSDELPAEFVHHRRFGMPGALGRGPAAGPPVAYLHRPFSARVGRWVLGACSLQRLASIQAHPGADPGAGEGSRLVTLSVLVLCVCSGGVLLPNAAW
jgi:hypothetical protein